MVDLGIDSGGCFNRVLNALDVGESRADVKVEQLQHVASVSCFKSPDHFQQFGSSQTKLGRFSTRLFPPAGTLRVKLYSHAEHRQGSVMTFSDVQDVIEFVKLLNHDHYLFAHTRPCEG